MIVECRNCHNKFQLDDKTIAGQTVSLKCPKCGQVVVMSNPDRSSTPGPGGPPRTGVGKVLPDSRPGTGDAIHLEQFHDSMPDRDDQPGDGSPGKGRQTSILDLTVLDLFDHESSSGRPGSTGPGPGQPDPPATPRVARPTITLGAGAREALTTVNIACATSGAQIHYTLNGQNPTVRSTPYTGPLNLTATAMVKARAFKNGFLESEVAVESCPVGPAVQPPVFSIRPGVYPDARTVGISCPTPKTEIRLATDGSEPGPGAPVYCGPIVITRSALIKARAFRPDMRPSRVVDASYVISSQVAAPVFSLASGSYDRPQTLSITCPMPDARIRYTTDGRPPSATSPSIAGPLKLTSDTTVMARAFLEGLEPSPTVSARFRVTCQVAAPRMTPGPGIHASEVDVYLEGPPEATIHYTLDQTAPSPETARYQEPIHLKTSTLVCAQAFQPGWRPSPAIMAYYDLRLKLGPPAWSIPPGVFARTVRLALEPVAPEARINYTLDGSQPTPASPLYVAPLELTETVTVTARSFKNGWEPSDPVQGTYRIGTAVAPSPRKVRQPEASTTTEVFPTPAESIPLPPPASVMAQPPAGRSEVATTKATDVLLEVDLTSMLGPAESAPELTIGPGVSLSGGEEVLEVEDLTPVTVAPKPVPPLPTTLPPKPSGPPPKAVGKSPEPPATKAPPISAEPPKPSETRPTAPAKSALTKPAPVKPESSLPLVTGPVPDLRYIVEEEWVEPGLEVITEGNYGDWFWVIMDGAVDVVRETPEGPVPILRLGEGSFPGALAALLSRRTTRTATTVAVGQVCLGVIDSHRILGELSSLSVEYRLLLECLVTRVRQVTQLAVDFYQKRAGPDPEAIKKSRVLVAQGASTAKLWRIVRGQALVVRQEGSTRVRLATLGTDDIAGMVPFVDFGHEPRGASLIGSPDLETVALDQEKFRGEYSKLSPTFRSIVANVVQSLAVTSKVAMDYEKRRR